MRSCGGPGPSGFPGRGRLTGSVAHGEVSGGAAAYTSWDSLGRPTGGTFTWSPAGTGCESVLLAIAQDDVGRTTAETWCCGCARTSTSEYDADGNLKSTPRSSSSGTSTCVNTISATARVCKYPGRLRLTPWAGLMSPHSHLEIAHHDQAAPPRVGFQVCEDPREALANGAAAIVCQAQDE